MYEIALYHELTKRGLCCERQVAVPVLFDQIKLHVAFRIDLLVEKKVIVEIKSLEVVPALYKKQLLNYLRLTRLRIGLLINFNENLVKNGITRLFNNRANESAVFPANSMNA